ncbi:MAG: type I methionyl aminopeptidase [Proteobacteria bacterium]|nr:type I methionyl aminopeptidase [Pseudomonadota bacterium]MBU1452819.1 type I methionyl aminopeptidase [Pseudomonadota bacterium]MBU2467356.1 type I methionyl aminopeptidase [Pseudomonadota bacterium]MBU2518034.1 type I methionyl aminopeptidase [Pseudomonadota bacterium]
MIALKTPDELELMARANRLVAQVLRAVKAEAKPGVSTARLDAMAEAMCRDAGAEPGFKGYHGYPYSLCCSVNDEVVHGFPRPEALREGDILSVDFGVVLNGFNGDAAMTIAVGQVSPEAKRLMEATERSLAAGVEKMRPGMRLGDVSAAIQAVVEDAGFSVVRQFVGHGIGRALHEDPQVPNFGKPGRGVELKPGLVLAIEPMVNAGGYEVKVLADGWTAVTADGKLSAHFEHTVAVTQDGPRILSLP